MNKRFFESIVIFNGSNVCPACIFRTSLPHARRLSTFVCYRTTTQAPACYRAAVFGQHALALDWRVLARRGERLYFARRFTCRRTSSTPAWSSNENLHLHENKKRLGLASVLWRLPRTWPIKNGLSPYWASFADECSSKSSTGERHGTRSLLCCL